MISNEELKELITDRVTEEDFQKAENYKEVTMIGYEIGYNLYELKNQEVQDEDVKEAIKHFEAGQLRLLRYSQKAMQNAYDIENPILSALMGEEKRPDFWYKDEDMEGEPNA